MLPSTYFTTEPFENWTRSATEIMGTVEFDVDFYNGFVPPPPVAEVYRARIVVYGNRSARLDERRVFIIVPPEAGVILI